MSDLDRAVQEARKALRAAEEAKEAEDTAKDVARIDAIFAAHGDLVSRSVGLRRALLMLHCPKGDFPYDPDCEACTDRDRTDPFPCTTYTLTRDWVDESNERYDRAETTRRDAENEAAQLRAELATVRHERDLLKEERW